MRRWIPKIDQGLKDRESDRWPLNSTSQKQMASSAQTRRVWMHCASGEFEYAKGPLREIKKSNPDVETLVTYFSPTYKKSIQKCKDVDFFGPLPLDTKRRVRDFLDYAQPDVLAIARTDLWPEVLIQCKQRNIPTVLFSKVVSNEGPWLFRKTQNLLLKWVDKIHLVSEQDQQLLPKALHERSTVFGDTRYDQCLIRKKQRQKTGSPPPSPSTHKKSLIFASVWPGDEKVLGPTLEDLSQFYHLIWVPHEPKPSDFFDLQKRYPKLRILPFSQTKNGSHFSEHDLLLVDEMGVLADLYRWGHVAFIGGSFNRQVHSVMESLVWGVPAVVGPRHKKNREALDFKDENIGSSGLHAVSEVKNGEHFKNLTLTYLEQWSTEHRRQLEEICESHSGASKKVAHSLIHLSKQAGDQKLKTKN